MAVVATRKRLWLWLAIIALVVIGVAAGVVTKRGPKERRRPNTWLITAVLLFDENGKRYRNRDIQVLLDGDEKRYSARTNSLGQLIIDPTVMRVDSVVGFERHYCTAPVIKEDYRTHAIFWKVDPITGKTHNVARSVTGTTEILWFSDQNDPPW